MNGETPRTEQTTSSATCHVCHHRIRLNEDGTLAKHAKHSDLGAGSRKCSGGGKQPKAFVIFKLRADRDPRTEPPYEKVAVYTGRTARDALTRFAQDNGIEIADGANGEGKHWLQGRKALVSFGSGQYNADVTTLYSNVTEAI